MDSAFEFALGAKAFDLISGFSGTITGRVEYLGCHNQYQLQPTSEGTDFREAQWFDEARVALTS